LIRDKPDHTFQKSWVDHLANGEKRKIVEVKNPDKFSILVFLDGDPMDGNVVGWPNVVTSEFQSY
jgi:hypothetical protein